MIVNENAYLEHHGILGQRWGVRRFQNANGSYKPAGKMRYSQASREAYKDRKPIDVLLGRSMECPKYVKE